MTSVVLAPNRLYEPNARKKGEMSIKWLTSYREVGHGDKSAHNDKHLANVFWDWYCATQEIQPKYLHFFPPEFERRHELYMSFSSLKVISGFPTFAHTHTVLFLRVLSQLKRLPELYSVKFKMATEVCAVRVNLDQSKRSHESGANFTSRRCSNLNSWLFRWFNQNKKTDFKKKNL